VVVVRGLVRVSNEERAAVMWASAGGGYETTHHFDFAAPHILPGLEISLFPFLNRVLKSKYVCKVVATEAHRQRERILGFKGGRFGFVSSSKT
jgi:hypothetical protein